MGKQCKNCKKLNHLARMCRSQVNEITEATERSAEVCNLIQTIDSCDEFEVRSIESKSNQIESINNYIQRRMVNKQNCEKISIDESDLQKIEVCRDPTSERIKSPKALVRVDHRIINMTVDTGSPISFLDWPTAKIILESSDKAKFTPAERLNLPAHFVDYNKKQPIVILKALKATIRSAE